MKIFWLFALISFLSLPARAGEAQFIHTLGDVPLAGALTELPDRAVIFDKPDGRIAEATAVLAEGSTPEQIEAFYQVTLPQMGWEKAASGGDIWHREEQTLTIRRERENGAVLFIFSLEPV